jgi:hypothetical protein
MSAFKSGQCASISAAVTAYNVPKTSLWKRIKGILAREDYIPTNKKLTSAEEEVLLRDILRLDA